MPVHAKCKLIKKEKLKEDIYKFSIEAKDIVKNAKPRTIYKYKSIRQYRAIT